MDESLDMIESRPEHPPSVFESADDYGEETIELQEACRMLGKSCSYELKKTIENRNKMLEALEALK